MSSLPVGTPSGHHLVTWRDWSILVPVRPILAAIGLLATLIVVSVVSLAVGSAGLTAREALTALWGDGAKADVFVVQQLRWPRLVAGLLVGAALGIGGCLVQTLSRNRLATPNTVGIDNGATAFAVASVVSVSTSFTPPAMALVGAATAAALALGLSGGTGTRGYRFIVVGIGIGALFQAGTSLILARAPIDAANAAYTWTVGSLNARSPEAVSLLAVGVVVCAPLAMILANRLALMRLPDSVAQGLGVAVNRVRLGTLIVAVVLSALSIAVAGPIGMVALVGPEAARRLAGPRGVPVVSSALAGALVTVLADTVGRTLFDPIEVPVGVITAIVGGPYLIWILLRDQPRRVP